MTVLRTGILHVPEIDDESTSAVMANLRSAGAEAVLVLEAAAGSQRNWIVSILSRWCDEEELDLVCTIGGTLPAPGPGGKEIVPEATSDVVDRDLPGLAEAMRAYAQDESDLAMLERGRAGIRGRTLVINLPGGAASAGLFLEAIVDVVSPLCAHLREEPDAPSLQARMASSSAGAVPPREADAGPDQVNSRPPGLNESEFEAFLSRAKRRPGGERKT